MDEAKPDKTLYQEYSDLRIDIPDQAIRLGGQEWKDRIEYHREIISDKFFPEPGNSKVISSKKMID